MMISVHLENHHYLENKRLALAVPNGTSSHFASSQSIAREKAAAATAAAMTHQEQDSMDLINTAIKHRSSIAATCMALSAPS